LKITYCLKEERKEVLTIFLDGDAWKDIHIAVFSRRPKLPKEASSLSEWSDLFNRLEYQLVKQYVLRRLSSQSYHSYQLKKLLAERLVQTQTIQKIIQDCLAWGYLDDQAWLESFVCSQLKRSSMRALMIKLQAKGLPSEIIQEVVEQWRNPDEEKQVIKKLLQTKYRSKDLTQYKERQKVMASLGRKGYPFDQIRQVLLEYSEDSTD
jgi:regulatory protein